MRMKMFNGGKMTIGSLTGAGGELSLPLMLYRDPELPLEAATKSYVDLAATHLDAGNIVGSLPAERMPSFTGADVTQSPGGGIMLSETGVATGTYSKVTVDAKGRITSGTTLGAADVPALSWSQVASDKPTTLAGYGITDGVGILGNSVMTGYLAVSTAPTATNHVANKAYVDGKGASSSVSAYEVGDVIYDHQASAVGFLRCNGGQLAKATYPALYAVVGDLHNRPVDFGTGAGKPWKNLHSLDSSGSGDVMGTWTTAPSLSAAVAYAQAIVTKSRVYLLGGHNGSGYTSTVTTAPINADGTLGTWTTGPSLPGAVVYSQAIVTQSRVYLLGGYANGTPTSTVYTAPINSDGVLGDWTTAPSLPSTLYTAQAIVTKSRVYLLGGVKAGSSVGNTVLTAPLNPDGTLGDWTTASTLPTGVTQSQAIVTQNRVYLLGGLTNGSASTIVQTAPINLDGTLGTWTIASPLPAAVLISQAIVTKSRAYLLGGEGSGVFLSTVYTAPINADGTLGTWTTGSPLPRSVRNSQAIVTQNRVFLLGGIVSGSPSVTVHTATLNAGLNDYSVYYNGSASSTPETHFCLPDLTTKDPAGCYSLMKY